MRYLPDGVHDYLPNEFRYKHRIEEIFRRTFELSGYEEVMPPTFEYNENFNCVSDFVFDENNLYRFFDKKGNVLTLRPDVTTQVARISATKYESYPLKLCYIANVFRNNDPQNGKMHEFTQAGIELLGASNELSDAECIAVAIEAIRNTGLKNFKVDIGQIDFLKAVLEELNLECSEKKVLKNLLERKNQSGIEEFLKLNEIRGKNYKYVVELPFLFGDFKIIERAKKIYKLEKAHKALEYLENVYDILQDYEMESYITFDLGMTQTINYYTGIVFRIFAKDIGYAICTGGRYDNLLKNFGKDIHATGFAINVENTMLALQNQNIDFAKEKPSVLIIYNPKRRKQAYKYALDLRKKGKIAEIIEKSQNTYFMKKTLDETIELGE